jgi:chemotaxis protein CheD
VGDVFQATALANSQVAIGQPPGGAGGSAASIVVVGMGQMHVARTPDITIATFGLGSCIGLMIWDPVARVGGLAHIVLADSTGFRESHLAPGKYADLAVPALVNAAIRQSAVRQRLVFKMAGGAQTLQLNGGKDHFTIGERNAIAVRKALAEQGFRLEVEDVGGNAGRTVFLELATGQMTVHTSGKGTIRL